SRIIKSAVFPLEPLSKDESVISRFFMKPFTSKLSERSKVRHCSIAVKSIVRSINFWLQLGVQKLSIRISERFKTKLIYELFDYCDSPDSRYVNVIALDSLIAILSKQTSFNFSQVIFALHTYAFKLCLPPRALALAQQILTSIALIMDSVSHFITFISIYHTTEEELVTFISQTSSSPTSLREFFEHGFKEQLPSNLSLEVSQQGVMISRPNLPLLTLQSESDENYTQTTTTQPLNLIKLDLRTILPPISQTQAHASPLTPTPNADNP
ncbi:MAG: hypothetical protein ACKOW9_02655, partial [Candidatus Paceibacterota bacterium]